MYHNSWNEKCWILNVVHVHVPCAKYIFASVALFVIYSYDTRNRRTPRSIRAPTGSGLFFFRPKKTDLGASWKFACGFTIVWRFQRYLSQVPQTFGSRDISKISVKKWSKMTYQKFLKFKIFSTTIRASAPKVVPKCASGPPLWIWIGFTPVRIFLHSNS